MQRGCQQNDSIADDCSNRASATMLIGSSIWLHSSIRTIDLQQRFHYCAVEGFRQTDNIRSHDCGSSFTRAFLDATLIGPIVGVFLGVFNPVSLHSPLHC